LEETVRHSTTRDSPSAAEIGKVRTSDGQKSAQRNPRLGPGGDVRGVVVEGHGSSVQDQPGHPQNASLASIVAPNNSFGPTASQKYATASATSRARIGKHTDIRICVEDVAAKGWSYDGSNSDPTDIPQHSTAHNHIPTAHDESEVPHDVDWRIAYGRRTTQDFGFPGACIKPRGSVRSYRLLQDPSNWVKRACGHFSHLGKSEGRKYGSQQRCRQCSTKAPMYDHNTSGRRIQIRASTESSISGSCISNASQTTCERRSKRRQCHSEDMKADRCGESLATDLGFMIDMILEEHTNSLKGIVDAIERTRPGLAHIRRISERLVQRCSVGRACPVSGGLHHSPFPYCPPRAAEKLNVGSNGQLKPTVNDSPSSLREAVQTVPDLVDLVNSAADNFGIDLERRPTERDDRIFEDAPVAGTQQASVSSNYGDSMYDIAERFADEQQLNNDPWLQQTRIHLSELAEARTRMLDELDALAGNFSNRL
jgi:hypothetical protein